MCYSKHLKILQIQSIAIGNIGFLKNSVVFLYFVGKETTVENSTREFIQLFAVDYCFNRFITVNKDNFIEGEYRFIQLKEF